MYTPLLKILTQHLVKDISSIIIDYVHTSVVLLNILKLTRHNKKCLALGFYKDLRLHKHLCIIPLKLNKKQKEDYINEKYEFHGLYKINIFCDEYEDPNAPIICELNDNNNDNDYIIQLYDPVRQKLIKLKNDMDYIRIYPYYKSLTTSLFHKEFPEKYQECERISVSDMCVFKLFSNQTIVINQHSYIYYYENFINKEIYNVKIVNNYKKPILIGRDNKLRTITYNYNDLLY
jgi:hypothetical protein